ncbi:MAG: diguanylate phosphodiesterase [Bryobacterales bacterium]|jgi:c-di-GMP-related signal transduction protein|nr:diguanylate phosphodiesterase [Bryobacterales bacterium]
MESVEVFVARQPIFDRNRKVWGYELLFRSSASAMHFDGSDASSATRQVISNSMLSIGFDKLLRGKQACINFGRDMLLHEWYSTLPKECTVIELTEDIEPDPEVLAAVSRMRKEGYRIALDDFRPGPRMDSLIDLANMIKLEMHTPKPQQEVMLRDFQARGIRMLSEKVETDSDFRWALRAGYDYFQGNFFARPVVMQGTQIPALKLHCLRMIQEAHRPELDFTRLAALISQDVALSYKLMRYANSAHFGRQSRVHSIHRALVVLGEYGIRKWISIAALPAIAEEKPGELITQSLVRGRFCELLAQATGEGVEDQAFLVGLFSLLDALLDRPLEDALDELGLAARLDSVLRGQAPEECVLNTIYNLVRRYEMADWDEVERLAGRLGTPAELVGAAYREALPWADEMART